MFYLLQCFSPENTRTAKRCRPVGCSQSEGTGLRVHTREYNNHMPCRTDDTSAHDDSTDISLHTNTYLPLQSYYLFRHY